jgi:hypothetical protein
VRTLACLLLLLAATLATPARADLSQRALVRAATMDESLEASILGSQISCLARVLAVRVAPAGEVLTRAGFLVTIEPVEFVKGDLDFQDSLQVYASEWTANKLELVRKSRGEGVILFFSDAGGYWKVRDSSLSGCGATVGLLRIAPGKWTSELARLRGLADGVTLAGLARRADLVVDADWTQQGSVTVLQGNDRVKDASFASAHVREALLGDPPRDAWRVSQCCVPLTGRQVVFLKRISALEYEPIPFAAPTRADVPHGAALKDATDAEVAEARAAIAGHLKGDASTPQ